MDEPTHRRMLSIGMSAIGIVALLAAACVRREAAEKTGDTGEKTAAMAAADPVERGKYLVTILTCNDCHTPLVMGPNGPEPDMSRMLSGHPSSLVLPPPPKLAPEAPWNWSGAGALTAYAGPWGISYAMNITPHETTGLGIWTEEMFVKALRTGKHMGQSRPIQPPMPWHWYSKMTDEDLKAIYAYLRTVPPIENLVPDYVPPPEASP